MVDRKNGIVSRDPEVVSEDPDRLPEGRRHAGCFLDDFPTVSREQAAAYLDMTLEAADLARSAR